MKKKENKIELVSFKDFWMQEFKDIEYAREYLNEAIKNEDSDFFINSLRQVVEAQGGIKILSEKTGLNKNTLYRTLSKNGNPELKTLVKILDVYGIKLGFFSISDELKKENNLIQKKELVHA